MRFSFTSIESIKESMLGQPNSGRPCEGIEYQINIFRKRGKRNVPYYMGGLRREGESMVLQYNISYEVASMIFLVILLFFIRLQYNMDSELNKEFRKLTIIGLIATILDVVSAIAISFYRMIPGPVNMVLNTMYFASVAALGFQLLYYDTLYVARDKKRGPFIRANQIAIMIYYVILFINMFTGWFFCFDREGLYVKGPVYLAIYFAPCYFVICSTIILFSNFRKFRRWQRISIALFVVFQLSGLILQMFIFPDTLLALFTSALGLMMMLFTMETPDYQRLIVTIEELRETKKIAEEAREEAERTREIAQQANRAKSDFLANMSHEIRTPINAVLGMDEMIIRESREPQILEYATDIKRSGSMLLSLINAILDFSKIESGKMEIVPVDYDLGILLKESLEMVRSRAMEKKLQIKLDIAPDTPVHLCGDEVRIRQILVNLLTNAIKYTPEGTVTLTVKGEKNKGDAVRLYVSVKDTGIGIKEEDREKMFESFQRVEESRNRNIEGTGLGLSITMRLLKLMDSLLEVRSTYGEGSDFYFSLMQKARDEEVIGEDLQKYYEEQKGIPGEGTERSVFYAPEARILVVDDNEMNLKVFCGLLKDHGMQIDTAMSGRECLEKAKTKEYHLIFMDHLMPEMDGIETYKQFRELENNLSKDAIVIILTANAVSGAREMFLKEGFQDYLSKPIIADKLEELIRKRLPAGLLMEKAPVEDGEAEAGLIDWEKGKKYCMDQEDFYREILETVLESSSDKELEEYFAASDFENYRIKIHSVKSNFASIGATEASKKAKELEYALKNDHDVAYVREHHGEFIVLYGRIMKAIEERLKK